MAIMMYIFIALLITVTYVEVIALLFAGKQYNRFFGTFLCLVAPVVGSIPAFIMASKYERRIKGAFFGMNDYVTRCIIIGIQLLSVFLLFLPFFHTDGMYVYGINLIFGLVVDGVSVFSAAPYFIYLIVGAFLSAIVNVVDVRYNIRNVFTYIYSLIASLTVCAIAFFAESGSNFEALPMMWVYCITNLFAMILSGYSLISVRNGVLAVYEAEEAKIDAQMAETKKSTVVPAELMDAGSYKCSKCGNVVQKGTVCSCRGDKKVTLNKLMEAQNEKETSDFCVYCKKSLNPGETCSCVGEGFGITVKPEQYEGRKCKYCGQILVGDSTCVCEKIMKKSKPIETASAAPAVEDSYVPVSSGDQSHVQDELDELQRKIDAKFSKVRDSLNDQR